MIITYKNDDIQVEQALGGVLKAFEALGKPELGYVFVGDQYMMRRQPIEASRYYEEAKNMNPNNSMIYIRLSDAVEVPLGNEAFRKKKFNYLGMIRY